MGQGQKEWADVTVQGEVQGTGRGTQGSSTFVRFQGYDGQVAVRVPDEVMPASPLVAGERVEILCRTQTMGKFGLVLEAISVKRLPKGEVKA